MLRALVEAQGWRRFVKLSGGIDDDILWELGLSRFIDRRPRPATLLTALKERLARAERAEKRRRASDGALADNARLLAERLQLSSTEAVLLHLAGAVQACTQLADVLRRMDVRDSEAASALLGKLLRLPPREVALALRPAGALASAGLVRPFSLQRGSMPVVGMDGLGALLLEPHASPDALLSAFFLPTRPTRLTREDVPHLAREVDALVSLLSAALRDGVPGVNVLLHGPPGTGKTELARLLAAEVGVPLHAVRDEDAAGEPLSDTRRFGAYVLCQRLLGPRARALVLFDEVEDVFPREGAATAGREVHRGKAWTNRVLEENPVPALWVSNAVEQVDPAYLRRFDWVLEVRPPPARQRSRLLARALPDTGEAWRERVAADVRLTPAHVERAARLVRLAQPASATDAEGLLDGYLRGALRGPASPPVLGAGRAFRLSVLQADCDLARLTGALVARPHAALCLYGPPGTGKTSFAAHLADALGRPLLARRASDLLGCYLGETEKALAGMFREAREEGAVLLLDEADSFLQDRRSARQSWEVTQVNELLVQMEAFDGVFLCATNAFERLDAAALRRFALKVRFEAPTAAQRRVLFADTLTRLGLPPCETPALLAALDGLHGLTPGDFGAAVRQLPLRTAAPDAWALLEALAGEVRLRGEGAARTIGFGAPATARLAPTLREARNQREAQ
jgi:SpoVK/Ycf46/Vps4 family AAA+-type ATPase